MSTNSNPFAYGKPITLDTLGDLFAHHRSLTGGFRMYGSGDGGGGDGGGSGDGGGAGDGGKGKQDPPDFQPITSQADLDKIIGARVHREREKFADYDTLKEKADAHDAALEAAKSDAEKAVDTARNEGKDEGRAEGHALLIKAEARATAAELKFRNPAIAVGTLDLSGIKVNDDGTVDVEAIKSKLEALATSDPYLVDDGKPAGPKPDRSQGGGDRSGDGSGDGRPKSIAEAREAARAAREKKRGTPKTA